MFDAPEFYEPGIVATIHGTHHIIQVISEGERVASYRGALLYTAEEFRAEFPDGNLPETDIEWTNNAWFSVYYKAEDALEFIDNDPEFSLKDAINVAIGIANNPTAPAV